jgi:hypothetical protein
MNEPKRWVEDGAPHDVEQLFRAAKAERPDDASLGRTLTALGGALAASGVTASVGAAGTVASGAAKVTATITAGVLAKWTAFGVTLGTLTVGAATLVSRAPWQGGTTPPSARAPTSASPGRIRALPVVSESDFEPSAATSVAEPGQAPPAARAASDATSTHGAPSAPPASGIPLDVETLTEEVRHVDRARAALASGRARETLAALDEYERRFPQRRFAPEALYLRMEAFASLGRTAQARAVAEQLLTSYPGTPNGARARAVLARKP